MDVFNVIQKYLFEEVRLTATPKNTIFGLYPISLIICGQLNIEAKQYLSGYTTISNESIMKKILNIVSSWDIKLTPYQVELVVNIATNHFLEIVIRSDCEFAKDYEKSITKHKYHIKPIIECKCRVCQDISK